MRRPRRMHKSLYDPRNEEDCSAAHREPDAEGHEAQDPWFGVEEDGGQPAGKSPGNEKKTQPEHGIADETETAEPLFSGHGATVTPLPGEEQARGAL